MMLDRAKQAGVDDALSAFGLAHGTPRPPPPWANAWLKYPRKTGTQAITIPSMLEKRAFDPVSIGLLGLKTLGIGGAEHVVSNLAGKGLRKYFPRVGQSNFLSGFTHGMEGRVLPRITQGVMKHGLGPESLVNYQLGHSLAGHIKQLPPEHQQAAIQQLHRTLSESPHLAGQPIPAAAVGGLGAYLKGKKGWMDRPLMGLTSVKDTGVPVKTHWAERAVGPALTAAGALSGTHLPMGIGINTTVNSIRDWLGHTRFGRGMFAKQFVGGAKGEKLHPAHALFNELVISPAYNDPRNLGLAINKEYTQSQEAINRALAAKGMQPIQMPSAGAVVDFGQNVAKRVKPAPKVAPAPAQAPAASPYAGLMTKGLLLGGGLMAARNALQPDDQQQPAY